jgi:hypothetical protein
MSRNLESESASFSSSLSTSEEEEYLNDIIEAIDRCKNVTRTPNKKRFDLRQWRKLCHEEEKRIMPTKMHTMSPTIEGGGLTPIKKEAMRMKPKRSSRNVNSFKKIELFSDLRKSKPKMFL